MMISNHPFHLVTLSPWPMILSMSLMNLMLSMINWFNFKNKLLMMFMMLLMILILFQWWRDIIRESTFQGFHTLIILKMMKFSMILFIISELFFFISFFWTFIHSSISSAIEINMNWPPMSIKMFNPYNIPLLNSIILISSGFSITWSHYCLINNFKMKMMFSIMLTIFLGFYFSLIQMYEYYEAEFCFNDSIFGSIFFMTTGFHGIHVLIGTLFICTCLIRININHFSIIHHFNFEAASWYWHFVDVIWLFLYILIYWWMN